MNEITAAEIDGGMIDLVLVITAEEEQISAFQIINIGDLFPIIVAGIVFRIPSADADTGFPETVVHKAGAVKGIRAFIAPNVRISDLRQSRAYELVHLVLVRFGSRRLDCFGRF